MATTKLDNDKQTLIFRIDSGLTKKNTLDINNDNIKIADDIKELVMFYKGLNEKTAQKEINAIFKFDNNLLTNYKIKENISQRIGDAEIRRLFINSSIYNISEDTNYQITGISENIVNELKNMNSREFVKFCLLN